MVKKIIIISRSEIIKRGISSIVRNNFNIDVSFFDSKEELRRFRKLEDTFFLMFLHRNQIDIEDIREEFDESCKLDVVWMCNELTTPTDVEEKTVCLDATKEQIVDLVSHVLRDNNIPEDKVVSVSTLSERETDVLTLVAKGFSNKEIGEKLFISMHTVISHRKNITKKLGIKSISGLTVYAILHKLIDPV